jgi:hypothetical protein
MERGGYSDVKILTRELHEIGKLDAVPGIADGVVWLRR